jgi:group I intron endonuclease
MIIYKVTNSITGKCYIGKTSHTLEIRKVGHLKNVHRGISTKFYNSIRKYGIDNFVWEVIDSANDTNSLNELEIKHIVETDSFRSGYNMTLGGDGGDTISYKTKEEKQKQGAKVGNIPWNKGKDMKSLGYKFNGRKPRSRFSDEQKKAHSDSIKKSSVYREGLKTRVPAKQNIIEDEFGNVWHTQKEWAVDVGITTNYMKAQVLSGRPHNGVRYFVRSRK